MRWIFYVVLFWWPCMVFSIQWYLHSRAKELASGVFRCDFNRCYQHVFMWHEVMFTSLGFYIYPMTWCIISIANDDFDFEDDVIWNFCFPRLCSFIFWLLFGWLICSHNMSSMFWSIFISENETQKYNNSQFLLMNEICNNCTNVEWN